MVLKLSILKLSRLIALHTQNPHARKHQMEEKSAHKVLLKRGLLSRYLRHNKTSYGIKM